jgi:hypothetical protein
LENPAFGDFISRKKDIREMSNFVGNAAAHIALLPDERFAQKEATAYSDDAALTARERTWTESEIEEFTALARKRAESEIKARIKKYNFSEKQLPSFVAKAGEYISSFIDKQMRRK